MNLWILTLIFPLFQMHSLGCYNPFLLSTNLKALTWSSVKSSATIHGTLLRPNFLAALYLVWPAIIILLFLSITIGTLKPKVLILFATGSIAS